MNNITLFGAITVYKTCDDWKARQMVSVRGTPISSSVGFLLHVQ